MLSFHSEHSVNLFEVFMLDCIFNNSIGTHLSVNATDRQDSHAQTKSMIRAFHSNNYTQTFERVERANQFLMEFTNKLSPNTAMLLELDEWKSNVTPLNRVLTWLGFRGCSFSDVVHENRNDYELDDKTLQLGDTCEYPFLQ